MGTSVRKILYSPGFGAGWSSWASGEIARYMLEYQPLIEAVERGEDVAKGNLREAYGFAEDGNTYVLGSLDGLHPAMAQFVRDCFAKFNEVPYLGGADNLVVCTGHGQVRIEDYDGSERVHWRDDDNDGWM